VVLGPTGRNFGAGMSGGHAYVLDELGDFPMRLNPELVEHHPVTSASDMEELRGLIKAHGVHTQSHKADRILAAWPASATRFWKVVPRSTSKRKAEVETTAQASQAPKTLPTVPSGQPAEKLDRALDATAASMTDSATLPAAGEPGVIAPPTSHP
jgi:glutamate synthase domain-containing protein 3